MNYRLPVIIETTGYVFVVRAKIVLLLMGVLLGNVVIQ